MQGLPKLLILSLLSVLALSSTAFAQCSLNEIDCCLTEFSSIIKPSGISLSEERVAAVCTFEDETSQCLDLFVDQCLKNGTDRKDIEDIVNRTKVYLSQICPPTSAFMATLKQNEMCILNASQKFQTCYSKSVLPLSDATDEERLKKECCDYKELRNCAVQTIENSCGPTASQLVHEELVHTNGALLEWTCSDVFGKCQNSAMMLASSAVLIFYSAVILKMLF